jgi:hypothetical protein
MKELGRMNEQGWEDCRDEVASVMLKCVVLIIDLGEIQGNIYI